MLSILIPVYNFDIRPFVTELSKQILACGGEVEIRCYDDGSSPAFKNLNREIEQLDVVVYKELPENIGRSAIRNLMGREAKYSQLLFSDCDSFPEYSDFLSRYIKNLSKDSVIYGGRTYAPEMPHEKEFHLRWKFGMEREVFDLDIRLEKPYRSFQTNNFVIPKELFLKYPLNERLKGYGHEDTHFGQMLMNDQVPIIHIDNPLRHLGLETAEAFLEKTLEGVKNLHRLMMQGKDMSNVKLARAYYKLKRFGLLPAYRLYYSARGPYIRERLMGDDPSLRDFDLFKLGELCKYSHEYKDR
jgi:hypothetical protein